MVIDTFIHVLPARFVDDGRVADTFAG